jgi:hypothetical protein
VLRSLALDGAVNTRLGTVDAAVWRVSKLLALRALSAARDCT